MSIESGLKPETLKEQPLPLPDSDDLRDALSLTVHRHIYGFLYERRDNPPTMTDIRNFVSNLNGVEQTQTDRRVRQMYRVFEIEVKNSNKAWRYRLVGWSKKKRNDVDSRISKRVRAEVLKLSRGRCALCNRTRERHDIVLVVDHKIPQEWGGTDDISNLQSMCEDCNGGKQDHFESRSEFDEQVRKAIQHDTPHVRIGEFLRATEGKWVPSDIIEIVASHQQVQEDWQKRLRQLRLIGWDYITRRRTDNDGRVRSFYRLTKSAQWPDEPAAKVIRRIELARQAEAAAEKVRAKKNA